MNIKYGLYVVLAILTVVSLSNIFFTSYNVFIADLKDKDSVPILIFCFLLLTTCLSCFFYLKTLSEEYLNSQLKNLISLLIRNRFWIAGAIGVSIIGAALMGLPWAICFIVIDHIFKFLHAYIPYFPLIQSNQHNALSISAALAIFGPTTVLVLGSFLKHYHWIKHKGRAIGVAFLLLIMFSYTLSLISP